MTNAIDISRSLLFENALLSVSRVETYDLCHRQFYFRYVVKADPIDRDDPARSFGDAIHEALEVTYQWVKDEEYQGAIPEDRLLGAYRAAWQKYQVKGVTLYQDGLVILRRYARAHSPVDAWRILGVEQKFDIVHEGYKLFGFIDRVDKVDDVTVKIVDYKSGRALFTREELDSKLQASVYGLAARHLYPWAERVRFEFHQLRHDTVQRTERTAQQIDDAAEYVVDVGKASERDEAWVPTLNKFCGYCDYRHLCDEYKKAMRGELKVPKVVDLTRVDALVQERMKVASIAKAAYRRQHQIDDLLKARVAKDGEFVAGGYTVRTTNWSQESGYENVDGVIRAFVDAGLDRKWVESRILGVQGKLVDAFVDEIAPKIGRGRAILLQAKLSALVTKVPGSPRIDVRAAKEKR